MRIAIDTSVLVAALVEPHPRHERAICWIAAAAEGELEAQCTWHALAETWAVLTRLPIEPAISPSAAEEAVRRLARAVVPVAVDAEVYQAAIRRCVETGSRSGALSDALHLLSAEAERAEALLTFNERDFVRLTVDQTPPIVVPPDPPAVRL